MAAVNAEDAAWPAVADSRCPQRPPTTGSLSPHRRQASEQLCLGEAGAVTSTNGRTADTAGFKGQTHFLAMNLPTSSFEVGGGSEAAASEPVVC